jgi:hypothetical protein
MAFPDLHGLPSDAHLTHNPILISKYEPDKPMAAEA